jgi:proteasome lid subunit RPN8/RPN11
MVVRLPKVCLERTLFHLRGVMPHEGVGLWLGRAGWVLEVWPLPNIHLRPWEGYLAEGHSLIQALRHGERSGLELVAIFHSHPRGPAQPSETDRTQAFWRVPYVIFDMRTEHLRAFRLPQGEEVPVWFEEQ